MARRRTVEWRFISLRPAGWRTMQCAFQNFNPTMQFTINAPEQPRALKLIRRDAETRQHEHENQAIPELQPPLDGFWNHKVGQASRLPASAKPAQRVFHSYSR